ncbi:hypothetical protein BDV96DRAFT_691587 [Lophiotrema nucula]|uniref:Uncharacterized protein n=1 Tax=Lophiotrema nucula TaxID=690887 RepID=A0A6A5YV53_9PLEO|nr:hypothetical protein BDV96DRAFT_691587 [Lophiotrema nucula]
MSSTNTSTPKQTSSDQRTTNTTGTKESPQSSASNTPADHTTSESVREVFYADPYVDLQTPDGVHIVLSDVYREAIEEDIARRMGTGKVKLQDRGLRFVGEEDNSHAEDGKQGTNQNV